MIPQNDTYNTHPIAHPYGLDMECFLSLNYNGRYTFVATLLYEISCYTEPKGTDSATIT